MVYNRKGIAPWSSNREAGIQSATVDGNIEIPQYVQPTIDTGFVDEKGDWKGLRVSDNAFQIHHDGVEIANGGYFLTPSADADGTWPLDMTGFKSIFLAIKPTNGGAYRTEAVMGPDSNSFANLSPVDAAALLKGSNSLEGQGDDFNSLLSDSAQTMTVNVWNIFMINNSVQDQKLLQFKITNNSGDISTIDTAFMRLV